MPKASPSRQKMVMMSTPTTQDTWVFGQWSKETMDKMKKYAGEQKFKRWYDAVVELHGGENAKSK